MNLSRISTMMLVAAGALALSACTNTVAAPTLIEIETQTKDLQANCLCNDSEEYTGNKTHSVKG
ncbi:MAG: hypothetical protein SOS98_01610 [Varibaculum sp.]|nr:hypothetical protein [Varibaculum sp.]